MRGKELINELINHPEFDPDARVQNLTIEDEDSDEGETTYQIQQGSDFIEVYNEDGVLIVKDTPPDENYDAEEEFNEEY